MPSRTNDEDEHLTPRQDLLEHSALAVVRQAAAGVPGMAGWLAGRVQKEPVRIYDINGKLLFLDFAIARGSDVFGYVRTAASQVIGAPVLAIEMGPRSWNFEAAVRRLKPRVKKEFPKARLSEPVLVCYSYPKLGVMFTVQDENRTRLIYDVADLARINDRPERPDNEGSFAWSYYESIANDDQRTRLRRFKAADAARLRIASRLRASLVSARALDSVASRVAVRFSRTTTKLLQFCSHYAYNAARGHHCFSLHGQQVDDYCAVATCQMILCYYRYYFTQDQI